MIWTRHSSFYHSGSYHICDLNLLLDFGYFLFVIELSFDTLSNFIEKKGWLNEPYYFMHSSYTRELQRNSKLKIALSKHLKEKKYIEKNNEISLIWCIVRQGAFTNRAY